MLQHFVTLSSLLHLALNAGLNGHTRNSSTIRQLGDPRVGKLDVCSEYAFPLRPRRLDTLFWLHFPKAGTSFATTVFHYACTHADVRQAAVIKNANPIWVPNGLSQFYNDRYCNTSIIQNTQGSSHEFFLGWHLVARPAVIAIFREPMARQLSEYFMIQQFLENNCLKKKAKHTTNFDLLLSHGFDEPTIDLLTQSVAQNGCQLSTRTFFGDRIWEQWQGMQTRMVLGVEHTKDHKRDWVKDLRRTTTRNNLIALARNRVQHDFAFVGILERWKESICLFHAMFGGQPLPIELENSRPGGSTKNPRAPYVLSHMPTDEVDQALYEAASQRFKADRDRYFHTRQL